MFKGSCVAIVTPFNEDKSVNFDVFETLINFQINNGTDAILVCGTTGEASTLTDEEQIETVRFAVSAAKKRIPVIAGAGSNDTEHGKRLCAGCRKAGADAVLLVTPYYNKTTQKGLIEHFTAMASAAEVPVILYNIPPRTGLSMSPKTTFELSKVENIAGIKESSKDIVHVTQIAELCGDGLTIYSGDDDNILPILALGGKGVISVLANLVPRVVHDIVESFAEGDLKRSRKLQFGALPLFRALFCEVNPIPVKAALNLMGYNVGGYRAPLTTMEDANFKFLKNELQNYGLL